MNRADLPKITVELPAELVADLLDDLPPGAMAPEDVPS